MTSRILLFGATGATGKEIVSQGLDRGLIVRAAERDAPTELTDHKNFEPRAADLLEGDLARLMDGVDAVVSAVGVSRSPSNLLNPPPLYTEGCVNIVKAMRQTGVKRFVTISAAFADPEASIPLWFKAATLPLERIFRQMGEMERVLDVCDDIDWTAVRPGWLLNRPATGDYEVSTDDLPQGTLRTRRADLAEFMLDCALNGRFVKVRPFIARSEALALESPPALIEELLPI